MKEKRYTLPEEQKDAAFAAEPAPTYHGNAAMRECLAQSHTGIIDEELHREVVGAINDEIPWLDDFLGIV